MKYLLFLAIKSQGKKARGFTLIELLVVVVILGVLGAVGLPNLLRQVSKAREAEAVAILGQINRAQQAYRYENPTFARVGQLPISGINNGTYYTFDNLSGDAGDPPARTPNAFGANSQARAVNQFDNDIRNYAGVVRLNADGSFRSIICAANNTSTDDIIVTPGGVCENGTTLGDTTPPSSGGPMF
ncbi:type IV pilin-like G/H family protein [Microcystis aeruginosa CS-564/01]|uniref:type IV pilin-like G/H family protein n=1 Tax=Microcystis aeruginosa TaxID=1126 RepID=UPI00232EA5DA|nr:type IV pilin-like G/H family protein [Microcystis aeruginosa]MDB9425712.1 type IV pilin-like G/H family protein [Microcystis aeruginosa CS-564/01]